MTKREEDVISDTILDKGQASTRLLSPSMYSIAEFIEKINPKDENFFKYIPNSFLNEEQKQAKAKALARELKISQKEKILPTVTPQDAFVDILKDPSINSISENTEKVNTLDEKNLNSLNDEDPPIADNNKKHNAKILKQKEDVAQSNPQLLEWLRIINAPSSINSISENTEKVNTLDEKNSKQLNDEDPPIADNNKKHSQDELRATLEAKVLAQEKKRVTSVKC